MEAGERLWASGSTNCYFLLPTKFLHVKLTRDDNYESNISVIIVSFNISEVYQQSGGGVIQIQVAPCFLLIAQCLV